MHICRRCFLVIIFIFGVTHFFERIYAKAAEKAIAIAASGESHALIHSCDCADGVVGGVARRASVIQSLKRNAPLLLLDAGGFAGGNMYDLYTEGCVRDSLRTGVMIKTMAMMGYDAVGLGDEEFQYDPQWLVSVADSVKLPIICANARYSHDTTLVTAPYRIVKKDGIRFGITAVAPAEKLFALHPAVIIDDPVGSIQRIWKKLQKESDVQVLLSHCGEQQTRMLAAQFPDCEIVVNGHRKQSIQPAAAINDKQICMQFGFQGKSLSYVMGKFKKKSARFEDFRWIEITDTAEQDPAVETAVAAFDADTSVQPSVVLDLYIMAQCPYGTEALKEMITFRETFPNTQLHVWFIGDIEKNEQSAADTSVVFKSLHGDAEVEEEMIWLAVKQCYPDYWFHFLYLRLHDGLALQQAFSELALDTNVIASWVETHGAHALAIHYYRSNRIGINASPTLMVNNKPGSNDISYLSMARHYCRGIDGSVAAAALCDSLPECLYDDDCTKAGKVGVCKKASDGVGAGHCVYENAVSFDFIAIVPDSPLVHIEQPILATTQQLFPGARIRVLPFSSDTARHYVSILKPQRLPVYLFGKDVQKAHNYSSMASGVTEHGEWLTFKEEAVPQNYIISRPPKKNAVDIFIDPSMNGLSDILTTIREYFPDGNGITILPAIPHSLSSNTDTASGIDTAKNELLRWLIVHRDHPDRFIDFLTMRTDSSVSADSLLWNSRFGFSLQSLDQMIKKEEVLFKNHRALLHELRIHTPAVLLYQNREVIALRNHEHLRTILRLIKHR